jgi:hypothetical protein
MEEVPVWQDEDLVHVDSSDLWHLDLWQNWEPLCPELSDFQKFLPEKAQHTAVLSSP